MDSFKFRAACNYRQAALIQNLVACDYHQETVIQQIVYMQEY